MDDGTDTWDALCGAEPNLPRLALGYVGVVNRSQARKRAEKKRRSTRAAHACARPPATVCAACPRRALTPARARARA